MAAFWRRAVAERAAEEVGWRRGKGEEMRGAGLVVGWKKGSEGGGGM